MIPTEAFPLTWPTGRPRTKQKRQEFVRETGKYLWKADVRISKVGPYHRHHDTWEEARDWLLVNLEHKIQVAERDIDMARADINEIMAMTKPADVEEKAS